MANGRRHGPAFYHRTSFAVGVDRNTNTGPYCEGEMMLSHETLRSGSGRKEMKFGIALLSRDAQLRAVRHKSSSSSIFAGFSHSHQHLSINPRPRSDTAEQPPPFSLTLTRVSLSSTGPFRTDCVRPSGVLQLKANLRLESVR